MFEYLSDRYDLSGWRTHLYLKQATGVLLFGEFFPPFIWSRKLLLIPLSEKSRRWLVAISSLQMLLARLPLRLRHVSLDVWSSLRRFVDRSWHARWESLRLGEYTFFDLYVSSSAYDKPAPVRAQIQLCPRRSFALLSLETPKIACCQ